MESNKVQYHGMITWAFKKKRLELTYSLENKTNKTRINWGKGGTSDDETACIKTVLDFVRDWEALMD
jgi:hypothetical protein